MARVVHMSIFYMMDLEICDSKKGFWAKTENLGVFEKSQISKESPKSTLQGAPGPPKRRPKSTPGRPLIDVNGLQISTWAPPGAASEFFGATGPPPRVIWSAAGAHSGPTWGPPAPQRAPRAHFGPPPWRHSRITFHQLLYHSDVLLWVFACFWACGLVFAPVLFRA